MSKKRSSRTEKTEKNQEKIVPSKKASWSWTITVLAFLVLGVSILWFIATPSYDALLSALGSFLVILSYFGLRNSKYQEYLDQGVAALLLILVPVIGLTVYFGGGNIGFLQANLPISRAFAPSKEGESLIIVSDFEDRSAGKYSGISAGQYVYDVLNEKMKKENPAVRIEHLHDLVNDSNVENVFKIYKPKLIIWGWYDALSINVYIKVTDNPSIPSSLQHAQTIIDPEKIQIQLTEHIPQKVSFMSFFVAGLERFTSDDDQTAYQYFKEAIDLKEYANESELPLLYYYAGNANLVLKNKELAFEYINEAIKYKQTAPMYFSLGNIYYFLDSDPTSAIEQFNIAISIDETTPEYYLNRGSALSDNGQYELAIQDFNKVIETARNNQELVIAYYDRGNAYFRNGNREQAKQDYDYIIAKLSPDYAPVYQARATIFSMDGDNENAFKYLDKAIELDPKYIDGYYNRGHLYALTGDLKHAISDFEAIIKLDPNDYEVYYLIGRAASQYWIQTNDEHYYDYAKENYSKAIDINDKYVDAYLDRASLYGMKLDYENAIKDYNIVIELDPKNITAYYLRGLGHKTFGHKAEAIADFQKVLELGPDPTMELQVRANLAELQSSP